MLHVLILSLVLHLWYLLLLHSRLYLRLQLLSHLCGGRLWLLDLRQELTLLR